MHSQIYDDCLKASASAKTRQVVYQLDLGLSEKHHVRVENRFRRIHTIHLIR